jgi:hypothetical protein
MSQLTQNQRAQRVARLNIENDIRVAIESPHSREALDEAVSNVHVKMSHERSRAGQSAMLDLVATQIGNGWLDTDWPLRDTLEYLSVEPEEFIEYLETEGEEWFDDDDKIEEIRENLID